MAEEHRVRQKRINNMKKKKGYEMNLLFFCHSALSLCLCSWWRLRRGGVELPVGGGLPVAVAEGVHEDKMKIVDWSFILVRWNRCREWEKESENNSNIKRSLSLTAFCYLTTYLSIKEVTRWIKDIIHECYKKKKRFNNY